MTNNHEQLIEDWADEKGLELQNKQYYPNHEAGVEFYEFYDQDSDGYFTITEEYNRRFILKYYFLDDTRHTVELPNNNFRDIYALMQAELDFLLEDIKRSSLTKSFEALKDIALRIKLGDGYYH